MRKFVKLGICGLMAAMVATGCSKKDTTGTTDPAAATTQGAETQEAGTSEGAAEDSVTLGEYKGVAYTPASVEITDEQVDKEVQKLADSNLVEVDRPAAEGDTVNIDYVGKKDGVAFDGGTASGYDLKLGSNTFIDGFEDGLVGAVKGQKLDLNLTFPDSYSNTDLAGKDVVFTVTINGIETKKDIGYEDLTDEYVSENFGTQGITTVDELKSQVSSGLEQQVYSTKMQEVQTEVLAKLLDECEVTIPDGLLDQRIAEYKDRINKIVEDSGKSFEDYTGKTEDEFYENIDTTMEESIKQELILEAIVRDMKLSISEKSFESFVDQYVSSYNFDSRDAFYEEYGGEDYIKLSYAENQALSKIMDSVKTTVKDTSSSDSSTGADDSSADAE